MMRHQNCANPNGAQDVEDDQYVYVIHDGEGAAGDEEYLVEIIETPDDPIDDPHEKPSTTVRNHQPSRSSENISTVSQPKEFCLNCRQNEVKFYGHKAKLEKRHNDKAFELLQLQTRLQIMEKCMQLKAIIPTRLCWTCRERVPANEYMAHICFDAGVGRLECEYCLFPFKSSVILHHHVQVYHEERMERCLFCKAKFASTRDFKMHMDKCHRGREPPDGASIWAEEEELQPSVSELMHIEPAIEDEHGICADRCDRNGELAAAVRIKVEAGEEGQAAERQQLPFEAGARVSEQIHIEPEIKVENVCIREDAIKQETIIGSTATEEKRPTIRQSSNERLSTVTIDSRPTEGVAAKTVIVPSRPKYQCVTCGHRDAVLGAMKGHVRVSGHRSYIRIVPRTKPLPAELKCYLCKFAFRNVTLLRRHLRNQHPLLTGKCPVCDKKMEMPALEAHACNAECEVVCEYCTRPFDSWHALSEHLDADHSEPEKRSYVCDICLRTFPVRQMMDAHRHTHLGQRFPCAKCDDVFDTQPERMTHMRDQHKRTYLCDLCGKSLSAKTALETHMLTHDIPKWKCPTCPFTTRLEVSLRAHQRTHALPTDHVKCRVCGKGFGSAEAKRRHMKIHERTETDRTFPCQWCPLKFFSGKGAHRHMESVHLNPEARAFQCTHCDKSYKYAGDLNKHLREHLGANIYKCSKCPAAYRLARELSCHLAEHCDEPDSGGSRDAAELMNLEVTGENE